MPLVPTEGRTWTVVLVQEGQSLPVFSGPDRTFDVVARLHAQRTDLIGTGGFRLARKRVTAALKDTTPFRWWSEEGDAPPIRSAFGEVVVPPLLDAMIRSSYFELSVEPERDEVPSEFANFEHVALGTRDDGWVLCFERDGNDQPLLVALARRGRVNEAALELLIR